MKFLILFIIFFSYQVKAQSSTCYGTTKNGKIRNSKKLPISGSNFTSYSESLWLIGRTYVHAAVHQSLVNAFSSLNASAPNKKFVYAETGLKHGGRFKPHKTHQNGLSVDLMVPVINIKNQKSVPIPTNVFNKWGYNIDFNKKGRFKNYQIDFDSLGNLIVSIDKAAKKNNLKLWRVIFAPDLQPLLYKTKSGDYIKKNIVIPKKQSWVRHDEHIHIDFETPCKELKSF